jgi:hypothetical protein
MDALNAEEFRRLVADRFEDPDPDAAALIDAVSETLTTIERLESTVKSDGVTVEGSQGQQVLHPALGEARQQRLTLARLLRALFPVESAGRSAAGKALANARWQR